MPSPPALPARRVYHQRRRYALGPAGLGHILLTLFVAVGAYNSQNNLLFWVFGFALGLLIVSGILSGAMLMRLEVVRERTGDARAGTHLTLRYSVHNHNRVFPPAFALTIEEAGFAPPRPSWFDRFRRRTTAQPRRISPPVAFVNQALPGERVCAQARIGAERRGPVRLSTIRVTSGFPFGLMLKTLEFDQPDEFVITPAAAPVSSLALAAAAHTITSGSLSARPGAGDEFFALRAYRPGDPPRLVAWRASARRGALLVRHHAAPAPRRVWIVLLLRAGAAGNDDADERAISLAAGAIDSATRTGLAVGLSVPRTDLLVPPRVGVAHALVLHRALGALDLGRPDARARQVTFPAGVFDTSSQVVIVASSASPAIPDDVGRRAVLLSADQPWRPVQVPRVEVAA